MKHFFVIYLLLVGSVANAAQPHNNQYWSSADPSVLLNNINYQTPITSYSNGSPQSTYIFYMAELAYPKTKQIVFLSAYKYLQGPEKDKVESWQSIWQPNKYTTERTDNQLFDQLKQLYELKKSQQNKVRDTI